MAETVVKESKIKDAFQQAVAGAYVFFGINQHDGLSYQSGLYDATSVWNTAESFALALRYKLKI